MRLRSLRPRSSSAGYQIEGLESRVLLNAGGYDTSFGVGGIVKTPDLGPITSVVVENDGKVVACTGDRVARYLPDGSLDPTLVNHDPWIPAPPAGIIGVAPTATINGIFYPNSAKIAVQGDGKILTFAALEVGYLGFYDDIQFVVDRYNPDGTVDGSFGNGGREVVPDPRNFAATVSDGAIVLTPDGRIYLAGMGSFGGDGHNYLVISRLMPDGSPDPSFGSGGTVLITRNVSWPAYRSVARAALLGSGQLLVLSSGGYGSIFVPQLDLINPDGSLAATKQFLFPTSQSISQLPEALAVSGSDIFVSGEPIDPDAAGSQPYVNSGNVAHLRVDSSGISLATTTSFQYGSASSTARGLAVQVDGNPVTVGTAAAGGGTNWGTTRLNPDALDPTWGSMGEISFDPSGDHSSVLTSVAIQREGQIIAAGSIDGHAAMARFTVEYPFHGTPTNLPATIQAEDFDAGVEGGSFHDQTPQNEGGQYRDTPVDIESTTDTGGGYDVGWTLNGEWLNYTIKSFEDNTYTLSERVANVNSGGAFHVEIDGQNVTGTVSIPNTGGYQNWTTISQGPIHITGGVHVLRLHFQTTTNIYAGNVNWLRFDSVETPFSLAAPANLPARLEAENFDYGGEGLAYHDSFFINQGGQYRDTGVDVETCTDPGGGYDVGFAVAGEWLKYTVNVPTAATYDVHFRVASSGQGGTFHLEVDGNNVTGALSVPDTLGWQNWTTLNKIGVPLTAGTHVLRLVLDSNGATGYIANFNWLSFTASFDQTPPTAFAKTEPVTSGTSNGLFQVTYNDNVAVAAASVQGANLVVHGPHSFQATAVLSRTTPSFDAPQIVAIYTVAPPGGWTAAYNGTYTISLLANQIADTSNNYAPAQTLGTIQVNIPIITGNAYDDANGNGIRDAGEVGLAGEEVYLDINNNDTLDAGEPIQYTDANGSYSFNTVSPGSYTVRVVVPLAHRQTAPAGGAYAVRVAAGQISAGNDFGLTTSGVTHFSMTGPQSLVAGDVISLTVTALDANGQRVTSYAGTVHFTVNIGQAVLPADYTFTAADAGTHTFQGVGVRTAGALQLIVTEVGTPGILGALPVLVAPAAATTLNVGGGPPVAIAGTTFGIFVYARDAYGNVVTGYRGTIHLSDPSGGATLPADYTFTAADSGYHKFSNAITARAAGWNRVTLTDIANPSPTGTFQVFITPASLDHFSVIAPTTVIAGAPVNVTVTPQDAYNNTEISYGGAIHITASGAGAQGVSLPADYSFVPATDQGQHVFALTFPTAGPATLMVADAAVPAVTGSAAITVSAPVPPVVTDAQHVYQSLPNALVFTFTKDVSTSMTIAAVRVQNLTTGASVTPQSVSYDSSSNTATIKFSGNLADGNYLATLLASQVADATGTHLTADYTFRFFFLSGDVNHDGSVNFQDLLLLAQHYGQSNASWAQGDLNYDATVGFSDLLILAQNYGHSLPTTAAGTFATDVAADPLEHRIRGRRPTIKHYSSSLAGYSQIPR